MMTIERREEREQPRWTGERVARVWLYCLAMARTRLTSCRE
jgi:hypothetical protein